MHITAHAPPPRSSNMTASLNLRAERTLPISLPSRLHPPFTFSNPRDPLPFLGCRKLFLPFYARFRFPSLERGRRGSGAYPSRAFLLRFFRIAATAVIPPPPPSFLPLRVCTVTTANMSQKILRSKKQKRKSFEELNGTNNRFLISINVLGSAGPIRFVVNEGDLTADVIDTALKSYARQGRLPRLGSDIDQFLLYCANFGADALSPWELIGTSGGRNFVLCKKQIEPEDRMRETTPRMLAQKGCGSWKSWLNKSFKILIH